MLYFYADCFEEVDGSKAPGQNFGAGTVSAMGEVPPACTALHFDVSLSPARFVLQLDPRWPTPLPGWIQKTAEEIEVDYPGLLGGS